MTPPPRRSRSPPTSSPPTGASAAARRRSAPSSSPRLAGEGAGDHGHLAPPDARSRTSSAASARGLRELFSLPDGYEVALGNGGTTAFWDAAAFGLVRDRALHLTYGEFSRKFAKVTAARAVPAGPGRRRAPSPGDAPEPAGDPAPTSSPGRTTRPRPASWSPSRRPADAATRSCSSTRPPAPAACRSTSRRPTPTTSRRRSRFASDGGLWLALLSPAALERIDELARVATAGSPSSCRSPPRSTTRARTRPTTRPRSRRCCCSPTRSSGCSSSGGLDWCVARTTRVVGHLYGWAERQRVRDAVRRRPGQALARRRHDRLRRRGRRRRGRRDAARQRDRRRRALPQARAQPAARRACSRRSSPPTCEALTACIDYVVEQVGVTRVLVAEKIGASRHRRCCASTSTSTPRSTRRTSTSTGASPTTTGSSSARRRS